MIKISRKRIARYVADCLIDGKNNDVLKQVAAYVIEHKRLREVELIIRDIHAEFEARGVVLAEITTANQLDDELRDQIKQLVGGDRVELIERLDNDALGGMAVETPTRRLDATLRRRLITLRESKG